MANCPVCHQKAVAVQAGGITMFVCRVHGPVSAPAMPVSADTKEAGPMGPPGPQGPVGPPGAPAPAPAGWVLDFRRNPDGFVAQVIATPVPPA